ncbi:catabolic L-serine/threonine dehydratase [Saxophila tyrrhenica]|uniref:L-serine ammonia-lyase n=1 Tax=Saxophila tyrrhenica TaxID=1690608 RepID=A0AAV9PLM7_9PEZI|nr:catabolic L-serine/threonine dehydratase [Saxophila tyrrhenica]
MATTAEKIPWIETPLIKSQRLSEIAEWFIPQPITPTSPSQVQAHKVSSNIFLKLENLQPSGSFKSRGIGNFMLAALHRHQDPVHFYCSSGGNAGLACVHAAVTLKCPATIVVPLSTSAFMVEKLRAAGAEDVVQTGESWAEADRHLREVLMAEAGEGAVYVPPFDAEEIWEGNATMVGEILEQLEGVGRHYPLTRDEAGNGVNGAENNPGSLPDAIICSVGGGGLMNGICQGIDSAGLSSRTKVIAMETFGADSLNQAIKKKELVTLPGITSIATSLGARTYGLRDMVVSSVASDTAAVEACRRIAEEQRLLVEVACGVCLTPIYDGSLATLLPNLQPAFNVVVVVCGGSNISLEILAEYVKKFPYEGRS